MKSFILSNDHGVRVHVRAPSAAEAFTALADERKSQRRPMSRDEIGRMNIRVATAADDVANIETIGGTDEDREDPTR